MLYYLLVTNKLLSNIHITCQLPAQYQLLRYYDVSMLSPLSSALLLYNWTTPSSEVNYVSLQESRKSVTVTTPNRYSRNATYWTLTTGNPRSFTDHHREQKPTTELNSLRARKITPCKALETGGTNSKPRTDHLWSQSNTIYRSWISPQLCLDPCIHCDVFAIYIQLSCLNSMC